MKVNIISADLPVEDGQNAVVVHMLMRLYLIINSPDSCFVRVVIGVVARS